MVGIKKFIGVVLTLLIVFAYFPAEVHANNDTIIIGQINFIDVHQNSWANAAITNMAKSGIINGYPDRTFKPDNPVSREEFALLISKTFYLDLPSKTQQPSFFDVSSNRWSFPYIEAAKDFFTGYYPPSGRAFFSPELEATREDVAVALVRTLGYTVDDLEDPNLIDYRFSDVDDISPNLRNYVALAVEKKLFSGYPDGTFAPNKPISRAEVASLLYKILKNATGDGQTELDLTVNVPETTTDGTVWITGKVTKGATVTINNEPVEVVQGSFTAGYKIDVEGTYDVVVAAHGGKIKTVTKQVTFERSWPQLQIDPLPATTGSSTITVTGSVSTQEGYPKIYVNDELINYWSNRFSHEVELQEGENTLVIKAVNNAGKTTTITKQIMMNLGAPKFHFDYIPETTTSSNGKRTTETKTIILKSDGPSLTVHDLPETTTSRTVTVYWDVQDNNDSNPRVYVNDEYISYSTSKTVTLREGENIIVFKAINNLGKTTTIEKSVIFTPAAPELKLDELPETTSQTYFTLSWIVEDENDSAPKVYVNDRAIVPYYDNSTNVTLQEGENTIVIRAVNSLGKTTTITKTITKVSQ